MAQQSVITQTGLSDIKLTLNDIAADLEQHVNDSLSKAHGINIQPGYVDSVGTDFTKYRNSNGDVIGDYLVSFLVNGSLYYAPAQLTTQSGQPYTTGAPQAVGAVQGVGGGAWVTNFTPETLAAAESTRDQVLIPHTQLGHWEAHGGMTVYPKTSYDSNGFVYARYALRFNFDGQTYEIPCDTSLQGVPQPLKVTLNTAYLYYWRKAGSYVAQHPTGYPVTATASGGTAPYTFAWYYREDVDPNTAGTLLPTSGTNYQDPGYAVKITFTTSSVSPFSTFNLLNATNISVKSKNLFFYVKVTDAAAAVVDSVIFRVQYQN